MKKIALLLLIVSAVFSVKAQKIKLGIQNSLVFYGAQSDKQIFNQEDDIYKTAAGGLMTTWRTGITTQYAAHKVLGLESGILFDLMGYRFSQSATPSLGALHGNTMFFNIKVPALAYFKLASRTGGAFFLGGGINLNLTVAGSYRYRIEDGLVEGYKTIADFDNNVNQVGLGYQFLFGIEDSEYSQLRLSYGAYLDPILTSGNDITPYSIALSFIYKMN